MSSRFSSPARVFQLIGLLATPTLFGPVVVNSLNVTPAQVSSGSSATGSVGVTSHTTMATVSLTSSKPSVATVPASVTINEKTATMGFTVRTAAGSGGCTRISAQVGSTAPMITLFTVTPPANASGSKLSVGLSAASVAGGSPLNGTITLIEPLGTGPLSVQLSSNDPAATVPATVTLPAGVPNEMGIAVAKATFRIQTSIVGFSTCSMITATQGAQTARTLLKIFTISG